jgi:hypothetical protein
MRIQVVGEQKNDGEIPKDKVTEMIRIYRINAKSFSGQN